MDTKRNLAYLQKICKQFNDAGIRTSIFIDPVVEMIQYAAEQAATVLELIPKFMLPAMPEDGNRQSSPM